MRPDGNGRNQVRITGLSAYLPFGAYDYKHLLGDKGEWKEDKYWMDPKNIENFYNSLEDFRKDVGLKLGLDWESISFQGFRLSRSGDPSCRRVEIRGGGSPPYPRAAPTSYMSSLSPPRHTPRRRRVRKR